MIGLRLVSERAMQTVAEERIGLLWQALKIIAQIAREQIADVIGTSCIEVIAPPLLLIEAFQRVGDPIDRRPQPFDQTKPGVGQKRAACGTMQQTYPRDFIPLPVRDPCPWPDPDF